MEVVAAMGLGAKGVVRALSIGGGLSFIYRARGHRGQFRAHVMNHTTVSTRGKIEPTIQKQTWNGRTLWVSAENRRL